MSELEKALYADVVWLKTKLEERLAGQTHRLAVINAGRELELTLRRYLSLEGKLG